MGVPVSTSYARVAFHAPDLQAPLARNELQTLAPVNSTIYARVAFHAPDAQAPLARNELQHLQVINGRSRLYEWRSMHLICKRRSRATSSRHSFPSTLLFMHEWRSMRLRRKRRSRATNCRNCALGSIQGRSNQLYFLCNSGVPCA